MFPDGQHANVDDTLRYVDLHYKLACTVLVHYNVPSDEHKIAMVGNIPVLGNWNVSRALVAADLGDGLKSVSFNVEHGSAVQYKWIIIDRDGRVSRWEEGYNKVLNIPRIMAGTVKFKAPWNGDAVITSVHDRHGDECKLDEFIQYTGYDFHPNVGGRYDAMDEHVSSRFTKVGLEAYVDGPLAVIDGATRATPTKIANVGLKAYIERPVGQINGGTSQKFAKVGSIKAYLERPRVLIDRDTSPKITEIGLKQPCIEKPSRELIDEDTSSTSEFDFVDTNSLDGQSGLFFQGNPSVFTKKEMQPHPVRPKKIFDRNTPSIPADLRTTPGYSRNKKTKASTLKPGQCVPCTITRDDGQQVTLSFKDGGTSSVHIPSWESNDEAISPRPPDGTGAERRPRKLSDLLTGESVPGFVTGQTAGQRPLIRIAEDLDTSVDKQSEMLDNDVSAGDNVILDRPVPVSTQQHSNWRHKMAVGIGAVSGVLLAGSAIYLATSMRTVADTEEEDDIDTPLPEMAWNYLSNASNIAYEALRNAITEPEPVREPPTAVEELVESVAAAADFAYTSMVHGMNSVFGRFL